MTLSEASGLTVATHGLVRVVVEGRYVPAETLDIGRHENSLTAVLVVARSSVDDLCTAVGVANTGSADFVGMLLTDTVHQAVRMRPVGCNFEDIHVDLGLEVLV